MATEIEDLDPLIAAPAAGREMALGAYDGASRTSRELMTWAPPMRSADMDLLPDKATSDVRVRDTLRNDSYVQNATRIKQDSIVGEMFLLNAKPNFKVLGLDETWATEFQSEVEAKFIRASATSPTPRARPR